MQLHFSVEQLQLLAEILSEQRTKPAEDLLDRVLARDLRFDFDELEQLSVLLNARRKEVMNRLGETKKSRTERNAAASEVAPGWDAGEGQRSFRDGVESWMRSTKVSMASSTGGEICAPESKHFPSIPCTHSRAGRRCRLRANSIASARPRP